MPRVKKVKSLLPYCCKAQVSILETYVGIDANGNMHFNSAQMEFILASLPGAANSFCRTESPVVSFQCLGRMENAHISLDSVLASLQHPIETGKPEVACSWLEAEVHFYGKEATTNGSKTVLCIPRADIFLALVAQQQPWPTHLQKRPAEILAPWETCFLDVRDVRTSICGPFCEAMYSQ